jgi:hypothetical protein
MNWFQFLYAFKFNLRRYIKALLKPFKPGENRFGDMDVTISEAGAYACPPFGST